jgi:hypothetical protein
MSLCHIWFGVARSNERGLLTLRCFFPLGGLINDSAASVLRTIDGLAGNKNHRFKTSAIRRTPHHGLARFNSTIFRWTADAALTPLGG